MFLKISQNSQKNTCARVSFLIKLQTLLRKRRWHRRFPVNFTKFLRTSFFIEHLWWLLLDLLRQIFKDINISILRFIDSYGFHREKVKRDRSNNFRAMKISQNVRNKSKLQFKTFENYRINTTAWKVSKDRVFSGPYFPVFGADYRKIQTRKNSVFEHFSHSEFF